MTTVISEKGQVTIPKAVRDRLGLDAGTQIEFSAVNGKLVGRKKMDQDLAAKWRNKVKIPLGLNVDDYLKLCRDGDRRR